MASNSKPGHQNQLKSGHSNIDMRRYQELANLSMLNATSSMPNAIPLSSSYLQPSYNCGYPPLPARRNPVSSYGRMGMGGSYYNPYSRYPNNMYSPGYGGLRMSSYGQYGGGPAEMSSFIQMAEESTRPAFESIESVVEVVSSISMMLESTYHAVHSSYSAILGVVEQFSRLKDHLAQMLSILALLRGLRWLCLKVLYLMKLRKDNPSDESAWNTAEMAAGLSLPPLPDKANGSAWPFLMFVGLVIGAPWLMFKLLSKTVTKKPLDTRVFKDEQGRYMVTTAAFDFKATQRDELSFSAGEKLYLSPSSYRTCQKGWVYACNSKQETGLIPSNYLAVRKSTKCTRNAPQSSQQRLYKDATAEDSHRPSEAFDYSANAADKFNEAFDYSKNLVENTNIQPTNLDYSKNTGEEFNSKPDIRDYPIKSAEYFNSQLDSRDYTQNSAEKSDSHLDTRNYSQNSVENVDTELGASVFSKKSTEKVNTLPNDKASDEVAKNQNMGTTET